MTQSCGPDLRDAWRDLDAKLRPFVARRVASKTDVDDVLQNVFLHMQRGLAGLNDEERFGPWMYQLTRNAIADHHRTHARHPIAADDRVAEVPVPISDEDYDKEHREAEKDLAAHMAMFVAMLPTPYREALTLTELQGLTQKEAAKMLDISLSGLKSRVQRGRQLLRRSLDECCHIALDARGQVLSCEPRPDGRTVPGGGCGCD